MVASGRLIDVMNPHADDIDLQDIASGLSKICRYNGQCRWFYSVAEHSVLGAEVAWDMFGRDVARAFLFHDAAESFFGDITSPIKRLLNSTILWTLEERLEDAIAKRFGVSFRFPALKHIDEHMLSVEWQSMMPDPDRYKHLEMADAKPVHIGCVDHEQAYDDFLNMAAKLGIE